MRPRTAGRGQYRRQQQDDQQRKTYQSEHPHWITPQTAPGGAPQALTDDRSGVA